MSSTTPPDTPPDTGQRANLIRLGVAELTGTFLLVLVGTAAATAAILGKQTAGEPYDSLAVALAFGLVLAALVAALGQTCGCHLNPAVTIALAVIGKFPWRTVPTYLAAQLAGAVLAALALWAAYGDRAGTEAALGATAPAAGVSDPEAFMIEVLIGFLLVFVVTAVATDPRVPAGIAPLAIGFALTACVLVAGPVSGGAANPVRALGPMIVAGRFPAVMAYVLGPIVGGIAGALVYDRVIAAATTSDTPAADDSRSPSTMRQCA